MVNVSIIDTGVGIKPEDMEKLFTEFCTINEHMKINPNGTGLGLYLSRNLARRMNCEIMVNSEYGVGSIFTLKIPLEEDKEINKIITATEDKLDNKTEDFLIMQDTTYKKLEISQAEMMGLKETTNSEVTYCLNKSDMNYNILIVDDDRSERAHV